MDVLPPDAPALAVVGVLLDDAPDLLVGLVERAGLHVERVVDVLEVARVEGVVLGVAPDLALGLRRRHPLRAVLVDADEEVHLGPGLDVDRLGRPRRPAVPVVGREQHDRLGDRARGHVEGVRLVEHRRAVAGLGLQEADVHQAVVARRQHRHPILVVHRVLGPAVGPGRHHADAAPARQLGVDRVRPALEAARGVRAGAALVRRPVERQRAGLDVLVVRADLAHAHVERGLRDLAGDDLFLVGRLVLRGLRLVLGRVVELLGEDQPGAEDDGEECFTHGGAWSVSGCVLEGAGAAASRAG